MINGTFLFLSGIVILACAFGLLLAYFGDNKKSRHPRKHA